MANSLAELEVLGLERFLDLGLPGPRRVLRLRRLLRGRGRAGGQAIQHLPDVEFPHGLSGASAQPGRGDKVCPRAGRTSPGRGQLRPRTRRSATEWECERKGAAGEKQKIIQQGNTATRRAAAGRTPGGDPSSSEAAAARRGCCGAASAAAAAASLRGPAEQQWRRRRARSAQPHLAAG